MNSRGPIIVGAVGVAIALIVLATAVPLPPPPPGNNLQSDARPPRIDSAAFDVAVREYLLENPEVIVEAMQRLEARQRELQERTTAELIEQNRTALFGQTDDPFVGEADAPITLVEFFDYQCPYCKRVAADLIELARAQRDVKIVFKEFPVFGDASMLAARAALAAQRQGRYAEFHLALMEMRGAPSKSGVERIASNLGLDLAQFRKDMAADAADEAIANNLALGEQIGVTGTPAFIIGNQLIPGALSRESLDRLIAQHRDG